MKLTGKIVDGAGRGRQLGFPTINVDAGDLDFSHGVYAVRVLLGDDDFVGAMHWGDRPTFNEGESQVEIFLLDFEREVYGEEIEVEVVERLRDVRKFESKGDLRIQIEKDVQKVRDLL